MKNFKDLIPKTLNGAHGENLEIVKATVVKWEKELDTDPAFIHPMVDTLALLMLILN